MTLLDNRKIFSDRMDRIKADRAASLAAHRGEPPVRGAEDPVERPRTPRRVAVDERARGPIYLLAGFAGGIIVATAIAGAIEFMSFMM